MFKKFIVCAVFVCAAAAAVSQTPVACSTITVGTNGSLNGFVPSPNDAWHQDITNAPIDPNSAKIITTSGDLAGASLHPDFSSIADGGYGIPYTVVDSSQTPSTAVPIVLYPDDSDMTLVPIPANLPVEGNPSSCPTDGDDRHALIIDRNKCVAYELYQAAQCNNAWTASGMAVWDFTSTEKRPYGLSSVDAAGLSVFEGLIRYDEIVAGSINHAIRFTAQHTKDDANNGYFTAPATHAAGNLWGTDNIMGMRIRLKASFDISGYSSTNQIILKAMKQYGMILADNGSNLFFQGTPDARWNDNDLNALKAVPASAFDVVQMAPVYDSATAPTGAAPVINSFTASSTSVASGASVTLTPTVTGASYSYIDNAGFVRGPVVVNPTATTTYTLTSRNAYGTTSAAVTVTVQNGTAPTLQFAAVSTQTYGAAPFAVSATSNSAGAITYSVVSGPATVSGSTVTLTGVGTVTLQASQAAAGNYAVGTAQTSFTVNPGSPALAFVAVPSQTFGVAPFAVSTTTQSAGGITYSVVSGPATVSGNQVTLTGVGSVTLQANQAAAGNYTAATATTTFTVAARNGDLTFTANPGPDVWSRTVHRERDVCLVVTYSTISGPANPSAATRSPLPARGIGHAAGDTGTGYGCYTAATATTTFTVAATAATLTFAAIPAQTFGAAPFTVGATSASSGAVTYSVVSGPATISGSTVTLTGVGSVTLQASQAAAGNYKAATATTTFIVAAASATLTFAAIPAQTFGAAPFTVSATSASSGVVTYSVVSGPATIGGSTVTLTGVGSVTLQASQAAAGNYTAATATTTFTVAAGAATLTFAAIPAQTFGAAPFTVSATSASSGAVTYSVVEPSPATISGNTVTLTGAGTVTLQANQAAAGNYTTASVQTSFTVSPGNPSSGFRLDMSRQRHPAMRRSRFQQLSQSSGSITLSVVSGPATISGNSFAEAVTGAGTVVLPGQPGLKQRGKLRSRDKSTAFGGGGSDRDNGSEAGVRCQLWRYLWRCALHRQRILRFVGSRDVCHRQRPGDDVRQHSDADRRRNARRAGNASGSGHLHICHDDDEHSHQARDFRSGIRSRPNDGLRQRAPNAKRDIEIDRTHCQRTP